MEAMNNVKIAIILGNNLFKIWFINIVNYVKLVIHKMIAQNVDSFYPTKKKSIFKNINKKIKFKLD